ncbi:hypothetical protein [uncultured Hydrogenophaga sp.]|uniref:hypothetical protein n=1 Tax=uncultured Hydrogenophaga sp. TaxID=199683 RepID=UPI00265FCE6A|nr:hypothetical protein [uncultured Hydrogenophaga sp.]
MDGVIREDWAAEPSVMRACLHVWHALSNRAHQLDHYSYAELAQLADASDESLVSKALLYLANPKLKVLKTCLMYEFDGQLIELPDDEVTHYSNGEAVIHPQFGEPIPKSEIFLCFTPGARLQSKDAA